MHKAQSSGGAGVLTRRWRTQAVASVWTGNVEGWWTPAVDAVAEVLVSGHGNLRSACELLGRQRADAGVDLAETRADAMVAARMADRPREHRGEVLDAVTLGWVDRTLDHVLAVPCIDPLTELAPLAYLATRLEEIHAEDRVRGQRVAEDHTLVVVRSAPGSDPVERETNLITVQTALRAAFPGGETLARVRPHAAVALTRRQPARLRRSLAQLANLLDEAVMEGRLPTTRTWLEPLPTDPIGLNQLVREINS